MLMSLEFLVLVFGMENSEILGFQFEPTMALQLDSSQGNSWEIFSSADSEPSTFRQKEASVDICFNHSQIPATKECLCYHEFSMCEYFKIRLYIYLLTILQSFFMKLINELERDLQCNAMTSVYTTGKQYLKKGFYIKTVNIKTLCLSYNFIKKKLHDTKNSDCDVS